MTELVFSKTGKSVVDIVKQTNLYGKAYAAAFAPFVCEGYEQALKRAGLKEGKGFFANAPALRFLRRQKIGK